MANFSTSMQEWQGGFAPPSTVSADKSSNAWGEMASKLVPTLLDAAGRGYAQAEGENILGGGTTAVEAQEAVEAFDTEVMFEEDPANTDMQNAQIKDMRDAAIRKFGTNDKKLQALVSAGKITSLEANARRHQMLQENLSNPILAMFKEDFLDAAKPFTGGSGELSKQYFGAYMPTEEERVQLEAIDRVVTEKAKFEEQVAATMNAFPGLDREGAEAEIRRQNQRAAQIQAAEEEDKLFKFGSTRAYALASDKADYTLDQIGFRIAAIAREGRKLSGDEIQKLRGELEAAKLQIRGGIKDLTSRMERADRDGLNNSIDKAIDGYIKLIENSDGLAFLERQVKSITSNNELLKQGSVANLIRFSPEIFVAYEVNAEYGKLIQDFYMGDKAAEFGVATDPYARGLMSSFPHSNVGALRRDAASKIVNNDPTGWSQAHGAAFYSGVVEQKNVKGAVGAINAAPEASHEALRQAFSNPEATLAPVANSKDWEIAAKTDEGAKAVALQIMAARDSLMGSGFIGMGGLPDKLAVKEEEVYDNMGMMIPSYSINAKGLPKHVQDKLVQTYKLLKKSPNVLKHLGANSVEEFIASYLKR